MRRPVSGSTAGPLIRHSMQRKPQRQTLSLRISADLRNYLERAREVFASHHQESVSTSEVCKLLLESAIADHLDDRLEVADLRMRPAEALWTIRHKWEQHQDLSRAEWIFLAQCGQTGCEELAQDPELPRPESFAQVLEAFLAVRRLRLEGGVELDRYYLGNLGWPGALASGRVSSMAMWCRRSWPRSCANCGSPLYP